MSRAQTDLCSADPAVDGKVQTVRKLAGSHKDRQPYQLYNPSKKISPKYFALICPMGRISPIHPPPPDQRFANLIHSTPRGQTETLSMGLATFHVERAG